MDFSNLLLVFSPNDSNGKTLLNQIRKGGNENKMKILQVNHGFPKEQEAGSEIYCYNLAAELKKIMMSKYSVVLKNIKMG